MAFITKNIFLKSSDCMRMAYMMLRDREDSIREELNEFEEHIIDQGREIGEMARELFPGGVMVEEKDGAAAAARTKSLMKNPSVGVIFEAAFVKDGFIARPDIIRRTESVAWEMIEVKSGVYDTCDKKSGVDKVKKHSPDAAYTLMLMNACGVEVSRVTLKLVSRAYRLGMQNSELFADIDITEPVFKKKTEFESKRSAIEAALNSKAIPDYSQKTECKICKYNNECPVSKIEYPLFSLSGIRQKEVDKLIKLGCVSIKDIPDGYFDGNKSPVRRMMQKAIKTGAPFIGPDFQKELAKVKWPAYYLDFETLAAALPFYDDLAPHESALLQYSLHVKNSPDDANPDHYEFIIKSGTDCRRELIEHLIADLSRHEDNGSIIVYSNYEETQIKKAIKLFPEFAASLNAIISRLFDLREFLRGNYYHMNFKGSYSIKKTLPAMVPGMSYDGLAVRNGGEAIVWLYNIVTNRLTHDECEKAACDLLEYCCQDTLAMVKLHERLMKNKV